MSGEPYVLRVSIEQKQGKIAQIVRIGAVGFERGSRPPCQCCRLLAGTLDAENRNQSRFALLAVLCDRLAGTLRGADRIEEIVRNLEQQTEIAGVIAQPVVVARGSLRENRPGRTAELEQGA